MKATNSLVFHDKILTFHTPELKVSAEEARMQCENRAMKLATFRDEDPLFPVFLLQQVSEYIGKFARGGFYDIWHVVFNDESGFIYNNLMKKPLSQVFVDSENLKVVGSFRDVVLFSLVELDFDSEELGSYICMAPTKDVEMSTPTKYVEMSTPETFSFYDEISTKVNADLTVNKLTKTSSDSGLAQVCSIAVIVCFIIAVLFTVILVVSTLCFVFKKRKGRKEVY